MKISAVLIVKNEEAMLARCLESVKDADEIIVCDTGSTDNTVEIAKQFTDKVYTDFIWNDSFADARNHAKSKATGDWILSIDADEFCHDFSKVREAVKKGGSAWDVTLIAGANGQEHLFPRLFRNSPDIWWAGAIHNHLNISADGKCDVQITYNHSPAHLGDPHRALRILEKECQRNDVVRELYYLGREYLYYKRYEECVKTLGKYVQKAYFLPEKADAFLLMSQAYWQLQDGDSARDACLQAININANFKEAILWMGSISWEWNAKQWHAMAQTADNRNVLFVRVK